MGFRMSYKSLFFVIVLIFFCEVQGMQRRVIGNLKASTSLFSGFCQKYNPFRSLHWSNLKGTSAVFTSEKQHLSPVNGAALSEGNWIENVYQFGPDTDATTTMTRSLFNKLGNEYIRPTANKSLPGASLTPEITGDIMSALEHKNLNNPEIRKDIIDKWCATHKTLFDTKVTKAKIERLLDTIDRAAQECDFNNKDALYMPYMVQAILLGHLYKKSDTKKDLESYIHAIQDKLPSALKQPYVQKKSYVDSIKRFIFGEKFKEEAKLATDPLAEILDTQFENTVLDYFKQKYSLPFVEQKSYPFAEKSPTPNCMEASMQNIFNTLLYDSEKNMFDFSRLPQGLVIHPDLKKFYNAHAVDAVNESTVGRAWMNLMSGKDFLRYKKGDYDLNPRVSNFIKVIQYFLNIDGELTLEELAKKLSDHRREIQFIKHNDKDNNNQIDIHVTDKINKGKEIIKLHLDAGHAWIEKPNDRKLLCDNIMFDTFAVPFLQEKFSGDPQKSSKLGILQSLVYPRERCNGVVSGYRPTATRMMQAHFSRNLQDLLEIVNTFSEILDHLDDDDCRLSSVILRFSKLLQRNDRADGCYLLNRLRAKPINRHLIHVDFPEAVVVAVEQSSFDNDENNALLDQWLQNLNSYPVFKIIAFESILKKCPDENNLLLKNYIIDFVENNKNTVSMCVEGIFKSIESYPVDLIVKINKLLPEYSQEIIFAQRPFWVSTERIVPQIVKNPEALEKLLQIKFPEALYVSAMNLIPLFVSGANLDINERIDALLKDLSGYPDLKLDVLRKGIKHCSKEEDAEMIERHIFDFLLPRKSEVKKKEISKEEYDLLYKQFIQYSAGYRVRNCKQPSERIIRNENFLSILQSGSSLVRYLVEYPDKIFHNIQLLIDLEVDINEKDRSGLTFLDFIKKHRRYQYSDKIIAQIQEVLDRHNSGSVES